MPASEILRIATTVGVIQLVCDLVAHYQVFASEKYTRSVEKMQRSAFTLSQLEGKNQPKHAKKLKRAQDDHNINIANVTRLHLWPNLIVSVVFLILMRILGTDVKGHIIGLLPFSPFRLMHHLTGRGLEFDESMLGGDDVKIGVNQAVSFTFVYMLSAISIKYYVHQIFGEFPPHNADSILGLLDTPMARKTLESFGIDPDELKND